VRKRKVPSGGRSNGAYRKPFIRKLSGEGQDPSKYCSKLSSIIEKRDGRPARKERKKPSREKSKKKKNGIRRKGGNEVGTLFVRREGRGQSQGHLTYGEAG